MIESLLILMIAILPVNAAAQDYTLRGVRLDAEQYDTEWQTAGVEQDTDVTRLVLVLDERPWSRVYGGLRAGYVELSRPGDPALGGLGLSGQSLGIRLGVSLIKSRRVEVFGQLDHDFLEASGGRDGQDTEFDWTETMVRLGAVATLGSIRLTGAAYRYRVDGDLKRRGPPNATVQFDENQSTGMSAGLELQVDPTGYIGVAVERGARDGLRLSFIREY